MRVYPVLLLALAIRARSETFDYVIAGAGTAGLVVANRLSEDAAIQVAVIEPGDDVRNNPDVLTLDGNGVDFNASIDWAYSSVQQPNLNNVSIIYHAGKAIGGTSNINGMVYIRGDKAQFDSWEALGNKGWNWDSLHPYFKLSENFTIPTPAQVDAGATYDEQYHGDSGYLKTGFPYQLDNSSFHLTVQQTWKDVGVAPRLDLNGGATHGYESYPQTIDRDANVRESSARAYYEPVESRPNLHIIKGTVKRVTWAQSDGGDLLASGVEYLNPAGQLINITAGKEVILSTGSYRTPLVLESSGVGNPSILAEIGIKTVIALPGVGESTHDQPLVTIGYSSSANYTGHAPFATFATAQDVFGQDTSAIAASTSANLSQWAQTISASINGAISPKALEARFKVQHDLIFNKNVTVTEILTGTFGGSLVGSSFWVLSPFSWGSVHLQSPSSINTPVIDSKLLSIDFDLDVLIAAGRLTQKVWNTPPLSTLTTANAIPGDAVLPPNASDSQWVDYIKSSVNSDWHVIGTCSMMSRELGGVVDPELKVYGTRNLRIIDASVIPVQMSGHPTATVYALAERASQLIRACWK